MGDGIGECLSRGWSAMMGSGIGECLARGRSAKMRGWHL